MLILKNLVFISLILINISYNEDINLDSLETKDTDPRVELMEIIKKNINKDNKIHRVLLRELLLEYYTNKTIDELRKWKIRKKLNPDESSNLVFYENLSKYMTETFEDLYIKFEDLEGKIKNEDFKKGVQYYFNESMEKHKEYIDLKHDMDVSDHVDELIESNTEL